MVIVLISVDNLTDIIYSHRDDNFQYGTLDCCIFVAEILEEYHGKKLLKEWRSILTYDSVISAYKTLRKLGVRQVIDLPPIMINGERKPISEVKHGDVVYYREKDGGMLGICNGVRAYFMNHNGLLAVPVNKCKYCWSFNG